MTEHVDIGGVMVPVGFAERCRDVQRTGKVPAPKPEPTREPEWRVWWESSVYGQRYYANLKARREKYQHWPISQLRDRALAIQKGAPDWWQQSWCDEPEPEDRKEHSDIIAELRERTQKNGPRTHKQIGDLMGIKAGQGFYDELAGKSRALDNRLKSLAALEAKRAKEAARLARVAELKLELEGLENA